jgi:hypothetical protein
MCVDTDGEAMTAAEVAKMAERFASRLLLAQFDAIRGTQFGADDTDLIKRPARVW